MATDRVRALQALGLAWFPRLLAATARRRKNWEFIGGGLGIHWEAIDEDISVASLVQPERFMRLAESVPWVVDVHHATLKGEPVYCLYAA